MLWKARRIISGVSYLGKRRFKGQHVEFKRTKAYMAERPTLAQLSEDLEWRRGESETEVLSLSLKARGSAGCTVRHIMGYGLDGPRIIFLVL